MNSILQIKCDSIFSRKKIGSDFFFITCDNIFSRMNIGSDFFFITCDKIETHNKILYSLLILAFVVL